MLSGLLGYMAMSQDQYNELRSMLSFDNWAILERTLEMDNSDRRKQLLDIWEI